MAWLDEKYADLRNEGKKVVAVRSDWARELGPATAAWLAQALFAQQLAGAGRWWFKKLLADRDQDNRMLPPQNAIEQSFEYETGLTRSQQEHARKILRELEILSERRCRWQRRLEYKINLDRLCEVAREWTDAERNVARPGEQENTFMEDEPSAQESKIPRSSTESIQISKKSSRSNSREILDSQTRRSLDARRLEECHGVIKGKRLTVEPGGIQCWTDDDRELASSLLEKHGEEKVRDAVIKFEESGVDPYPSRIRKILSSSTIPAPIEQTSAHLRSYDVDENARSALAAGRKAVQLLSDSERDAFIPIFIEQLDPSYKTTYNATIRKFFNPAEKLQFERWVEKRLTLDR
jgi:hypothetical protein